MDTKRGKSLAILIVALSLAMVVPPIIGIAISHVVGTWAGPGGAASRPQSDDDGELHDGWDASCGYQKRDQTFRVEESSLLEEYRGLSVAFDIDVTYPEFSGAGDYTDKLNEAVRDAALETANDCYQNPTQQMVRIVRDAAELGGADIPGGVDAVVVDEVTYAVTYNTADFVSVSFSDMFSLGSSRQRFIKLRCVNMNLRTGEIYDVDQVLAMDEDIANTFVDALVENAGEDDNQDGIPTEDECFSVSIIGRDAWVKGLMGEGDASGNIKPTFFVDEKGRFNLAASYGFGNEMGSVTGWWDATISDELLKDQQLDSSFWGLLEKDETDS